MKLMASTVAVVLLLLAAIAAVPSKAQSQDEIATLSRECNRGDRNAMIQCYNLGLRYMYGNGVAKDLQRARALFARSCDGTIAEACHNVAYLSNNTHDRAAYYGAACKRGYQAACKPWAANAFELGVNAYRQLSQALISGHPGIQTVEQAENVRARAIGDLTVAARYDPALAARANEIIAKLRALDIRAAW